MADNALSIRVEECRTDFAAVHGQPFQHFYCPILLRDDEGVPLIKGHVVNAALKSAGTWVPQRRDVDEFYGAVEADLVTIIKDRSRGVFGVFLDPSARRRHQPELTLKGQTVEHYLTKPGQRTPPSHTTAVVTGDDNRVLGAFAVKNAASRLAEAKDGDLEIVLRGDFRAAAIAAMLKSAHLTLFRVLGYEHVASAAGRLVANILSTFFEEHRDGGRVSQAAVERHFLRHQNMVAPILVQQDSLFQGTVKDKLFLTCWTSKDEIFALGVIVKAGPDRYCIFLPTDCGHTINTYVSFLNEPPNSLRTRLTRFRRPTAEIQGCWQVDTNDLRIPMRQDIPEWWHG